MSVSGDIIATYRGPGRAMARLLAMPEREGRVLAYGLGFCFITFIAYLPRLSQESARTGQDPGMAIGGALLAWVVIVPLFLYLLAALSRLMARAFGGRGDGYGARLALFWALFASSPLVLMYGLVAGFTGSGPAVNVAGALWLAVFLWFWVSGLRVAERGAR